MEDGDYYIKDFYIKKDYTINHPDLHYGKGFMEFHSSLINRFKVDSKGLVLFHGDPGTGKTFYIRSLIGDLVQMGRNVIYLPPNMVDHMVNPEMMSFISSTVLQQAENGKTCVLLLEDAEPLLVSRKMDGRSNGITNLLNVTDGLLNDMLSIQVIATFNTDLSNIDEALLRPERLIARKEFKKLSLEDSKKLGDVLGLEIAKSSTLAEIYSKDHSNEILIHEYQSDHKKMGF
jgi:SpoVK/Ycf46/Vps4 family AAA+-type ATPase